MMNIEEQIKDQEIASKLFNKEFDDKTNIVYLGGVRVNTSTIGFVCEYVGIQGRFFYLYKLDASGEYNYLSSPILSRFLTDPEFYLKR